jgi:hypothetical protein
MSSGQRPGALLIAAMLVGVGACSGSPAVSSPVGAGSPSLAAPSPAGSRPASPAVIAITKPAANQVITGSTIHVAISLKNAQIVAATTTDLRPDRGHVHLYVDNQLVSMNYGLEQDLPVHPGTYVLKAEFVASDHAPFNPRVWSSEVLFTVK